MESSKSLPQSEHTIRESLDSWNDCGYKIEYFGEDLKAIILGEIHEVREIIRKQLKLIAQIKPDFVLHEFGAAWVYDPKNKQFKPQIGRQFNIVDRLRGPDSFPGGLISLSHNYGFKIVGCDLSDGELTNAEKRFALQNPQKYKLIKRDPVGLTPQSDELIPYRDLKMAELITAYQNKSTKPVITVLGNAHARNIHNGKLIQGKGFGYAYVDQTSESESTDI